MGVEGMGVVDETNKPSERSYGQNWAGRLQEARWKVKMLPGDEIVRSEQFKVILDQGVANRALVKHC